MISEKQLLNIKNGKNSVTNYKVYLKNTIGRLALWQLIPVAMADWLIIFFKLRGV